jgi:hypothetical protein
MATVNFSVPEAIKQFFNNTLRRTWRSIRRDM